MIKYEDLREGDIVSAVSDDIKVMGPIKVSEGGNLYYSFYGVHVYIDSDEFVTAHREKQLPTEVPARINNVRVVGDNEAMSAAWAILHSDGLWYTSKGAVVQPSDIVLWEEV